MRRRFRHLTKTDRVTLEVLLRRKTPVKDIAAELGVHISTVYREIKRGQVLQLTSELVEEHRYTADTAHRKYRENLKEKGPGLKIGNDRALADYIEYKILKEDYSPAAVLGEIKRSPELKFSTTISEFTLYSYIDKGIFLNLTNKNLPVKGKRKGPYRKVRKLARPPRGKSIEKRPEEINERTTFGNWEMDTVEGPKKTKPRLLVLTERLTRQEIAIKLPDGTSASVVRALDGLEKRYGKLFPIVFRTITVDNGSEFADCEGMERSRTGKGKRTEIYYCHPYTSCERGSNENQNKMLRRRFPKGTDFRKVSAGAVAAAVEWLNNYPRELFDFGTSAERFQEELLALA